MCPCISNADSPSASVCDCVGARGCLYTPRCWEIHFFHTFYWQNRPIISHKFSLKWSQIIFISTKFRWFSSHFCFDHFYIVNFHSALTLLDVCLLCELRALRELPWVALTNHVEASAVTLGYWAEWKLKSCLSIHRDISLVVHNNVKSSYRR